MFCEIDIYLDRRWQRVATAEAVSATEAQRGYLGRTHLSYDFDYVAGRPQALGATDMRAVSCRYPVSFELHSEATWPAFLLDVLPAGAGRRALVKRLGLRDAAGVDWELLATAQNPPGNLRVAPAQVVGRVEHGGFDYEDVVQRGENFIEYADQHGAPVAGSSGALGDAPKFLLTQDKAGRWHADGALSDARAAKHWIVKFPRGKALSDRAVLRNEAAYLAVAMRLGLRVYELARFDRDALFVPRFDRRVDAAGVERLGQETLCSLLGVAEYGVRFSQQQLCAALARHSTQAAVDLREYVMRDVLNVAMGNTDNHARNTSVSKYEDGSVTLAPLYDFAPMILDDQGIPRACRWRDAERLGMPDWGKVAEEVGAFGVDSTHLRADLADFAQAVERLDDTMAACGVDDALIESLTGRTADVAASLRAARPHPGSS